MFGYDLGIDLGTSNLVISVPDKGVVLNEPSYVAYDTESERVLYAGRRAYYLQGREPKGVTVAQPLMDGVISNYDLTQQMVRYFINRVIKKSIFKPRVVASVPALATDVEKRTLISVIVSAGARSVCLIEEPLCAAFGAGVDPQQPNGAFVVDIGGGTTNMAVVSQGSMSQIENVKIAGNTFDDEIVRFVKEKYDVLIGLRTAEDIKKTIGCAVQRDEDIAMAVKGRSGTTGMPKVVDVTSNEIYHCLQPLLAEIIAAAQIMFERTSPQLVADITTSSILLTGGSAELYGMDRLFNEALELEVEIAPQPNLCVAKGAVVALNKMHILDNYGYSFKTKEDVRIR
ncbi:MAG: rod shape-determining protein [Eubacteriales bacterium]|nr:rod shape-determining protein [Eubacteriales bacterium]